MTDEEINKLGQIFADSLDIVYIKDNLTWHQLKDAYITGFKSALKKIKELKNETEISKD